MTKKKKKEDLKNKVLVPLTVFNTVLGIVSGIMFVNAYNDVRGSKYGLPYTIFLSCIIVAPWIVNTILIRRQSMHLKKSLEDISEANEKLKYEDNAKSRYIATISHEIRTPVNAMMGFSEMIKVESNEKNIVEYADNIHDSGKTLLNLINDILDYSKIESGKMELVSREYDLASVINDLLNMIELRAKSKGLKFEVKVNENIPRRLYGDDLRIKQIILNLLTNSVKYTNNGIVSLFIDYVKNDDNYITLNVRVQDTGIGMKQDEIDRLANPFERFSEENNRGIEGTGLGMSIVVNLLKEMDTKLEVNSEYGVGSCISFDLVQRVVGWYSIGELKGRYHDVNSEEDKDSDYDFYAPKAVILVVDDTEVNLKVIKGLLKGTGMQIDTAMSGPECLEKANEKRYDVILLDHRMPGMDGVVTLRNLKASNTPNNDTPVIALTANVVAGAKESYLKDGFVGYLAKPVSKKNLKKMLLKYISSDIIEEDVSEELLNSEIQKDDRDKVLSKHVDIDAGVEACGSMELLKEIAMEFADSADNYCYEIQNYYEQEDYKNYTVKVHALKSSARLVGAKELSSEARYLENCGNYGDIDEIKAKTDLLLGHCLEVADELRQMFAVKKDNVREISHSEFKEALAAISCFNDAFDYDKVDEIMNMLSEYKIPDSMKETYDEMKKHVLNVDQENIRATVKKFLGGHKNE